MRDIYVHTGNKQLNKLGSTVKIVNKTPCRSKDRLLMSMIRLKIHEMLVKFMMKSTENPKISKSIHNILEVVST